MAYHVYNPIPNAMIVNALVYPRCSLGFSQRHITLLYNRLLSDHGLLKIYTHTRLPLRHNNVELGKNVKQQPISKLGELVWLNKLD